MIASKNILIIFTVISLFIGISIYNKKKRNISFSEYTLKYGIYFDSKFEEKYREKVFNSNIVKIENHNLASNSSYEMGINQFTHFTKQQFAQVYLRTIVPTSNIVVDQSFISVGDVNWVSNGAVTNIKNQGQCGSSWAFSATGALEGWWKIVHKNLQSLSQQQLIDCSDSYGNNGCDGGLMIYAFKYSKQHGLNSQVAYPYKAVKQQCHTSMGWACNNGHIEINGCTDIANAIIQRPISVIVDANNWFLYKSGIFNDCKKSLNHGVLIVGITDKYWLVKNSWGAQWGESGYIRIERGNTCGICNQASYPI